MLIENSIIKNIYLLSPILFAKFVTNNQYKAPMHIRYLEQYIIPKLLKGNARIIINIPPRHGKSEFLSKYLPIWYLINFHNTRIILTSYGSDLAKFWSRQIKEHIALYGNKATGIKLNPKNAAINSFSILGHNGGMQAVGINGALTGKGADLIIIDDPVKNDKEANSINIRNKLWEWYKATLYTRLEPNGSIILIMTRWHEDDLCGRIIKHNKSISNNETNLSNNEIGNWDNIILPSIAGDNCPLGRKIGEPLWNNRFPIEKLNELRFTLGDYWFESLYQQSPYSTKGGIFKSNEFKYFKFVENQNIEVNNKIIRNEDLRKFITVDLAASSKENSDYTVLLAFALDIDNNIYILDILREHFDTLNHQEIIKDLYFKWKPISVGIEAVQYQNALVRSVSANGIPAIPIRPNKDKISRALPMQAKLNSGLVYLPKYENWVNEFLSELTAFPYGKNDDQVDCFAYINELISPYGNNFIPTGRKL